MSIYVGDVGTRLELEFRDYEDVNGQRVDNGPLDISDAEEIVFYAQKTDGSLAMEKRLTEGQVKLLDAEDGVAYYDTEEGFIDQPGTWRLQGWVKLAEDMMFWAKTVTFQVEAPLPR